MEKKLHIVLFSVSLSFLGEPGVCSAQAADGPVTTSCYYSGLDLCLEPPLPFPSPKSISQFPAHCLISSPDKIQGPEKPEQVKKPKKGGKPEGRKRGREEKGRQGGGKRFLLSSSLPGRSATVPERGSKSSRDVDL